MDNDCVSYIIFPLTVEDSTYTKTHPMGTGRRTERHGKTNSHCSKYATALKIMLYHKYKNMSFV